MRYSTRKNSTSRSPSCRKPPSSTVCSSDATSQPRAQRIFKNSGQTKSALRFTPTHRVPRTAVRGHEIECRVVGFARSLGDGRFKRAQGLSSRFASECRINVRSYGQALPGQYDRGWSSQEDIIQKPRTHGRNQGPCTLVTRTQDSPGVGLHSQ